MKIRLIIFFILCMLVAGFENRLSAQCSPVAPPSTIVATATTICSGSSVTFSVTNNGGVTGGSNQWTINGTFMGAMSTFTTSTLHNGDQVACTVVGPSRSC